VGVSPPPGTTSVSKEVDMARWESLLPMDGHGHNKLRLRLGASSCVHRAYPPALAVGEKATRPEEKEKGNRGSETPGEPRAAARALVKMAVKALPAELPHFASAGKGEGVHEAYGVDCATWDQVTIGAPRCWICDYVPQLTTRQNAGDRGGERGLLCSVVW
jgi:hypothetical protein